MIDGDAKRVAEAGLSDYQLLSEIDRQKIDFLNFATDWRKLPQEQQGPHWQEMEDDWLLEIEKLEQLARWRGLSV